MISKSFSLTRLLSPFGWLNLFFLVCLSILMFFSISHVTWKFSLLILLGIYFFLLFLGVRKISWNFFLPSISRLSSVILDGHEHSNKKTVLFTFDDGPCPKITPYLLDLLQKRGVKALFFCIGSKVRQFPELARRIIEEGHEIGNHSYHHSWWTNFLLTQGMIHEIEKAQEAIENATNLRPRFYRPPMGLTNPHLARALQKQGLVLMGWNAGGGDQKKKDANFLFQRIWPKIKNQSIILLHDGKNDKEKILALVDLLIRALKENDYDILSPNRITLKSENFWNSKGKSLYVNQ